MPLFTRKFIKDLIFIVIVGSLLYALTHNPLTHPTLQETKGLWSIQLMQHPLVLGVAGHNFLTIRDDHNRIVGELHGLATDSITGEWKYVGNKESDLLQVWYFDNAKEYKTQKSYPGVVLAKGDKETITSLWKSALFCKDAINEEHFHYPPYGVNIHGDTENSNSVAYTLILCMDLDPTHIGLLTPGWGKSLLGSGEQRTDNR